MAKLLALGMHLSQTISDVVIDGVGVAELVLGGVDSSHAVDGGADERISANLVRRSLPEHAATEATGLGIGNLLTDQVGGIVGDESASAGVVAVGGAGFLVVLDSGTGLGKLLVVPDTSLPATLANAREGLTGAVSADERTAVDGQTQDKLLSRDSTSKVSIDGVDEVEGSGSRVGGAGVEVGLMTAGGIPRASKIVGHEVDMVENIAKLSKLEPVIMLSSSRGGNRELKVVSGSVLGSIAVEFLTDALKKQDHIGSLLVAGRVLPVDVNTVKAPIFHEGDGCPSKGSTALLSSGGGGEVGRPGPATNGQHDLEATVGLLQLVKLLDATISIGTRIIPSYHDQC